MSIKELSELTLTDLIKDSCLVTILKAFAKLLPQLLTDFFRKYLWVEEAFRDGTETANRSLDKWQACLIGALTTFRVGEKIANMFGWTVDKMTIWKSVQKTA